MVILWWKLSRDESYLVMKVMLVKEVMTGDVSPVAMFQPILMSALRRWQYYQTIDFYFLYSKLDRSQSLFYFVPHVKLARNCCFRLSYG